MKKILGLDLGTNSIGWAVVNGETIDVKGNKEVKLTSIEAAGSRIIPMDAEILGDFEKGNSVSQTKDRTQKRGVRRLLQRRLLRRERLNRVLAILEFLPKHYSASIDRYGKLLPNTEEKIAWCKNARGEYEFLFMDSFNEMVEEFKAVNPQLFANGKKIPYDWTIYYLRKKALEKPISKEELAWVLHNFNQKRGYSQLRDIEGATQNDETKAKVRKEFGIFKVVSVVPINKRGFCVTLDNGYCATMEKGVSQSWVGMEKEFIITTHLNSDGTEKINDDGIVKRTFSVPNEEDWELIKTKTESTIKESKKSVGAYIYAALLANQNQKIIGKLVQTIDRSYYRNELLEIVKKQSEFIPELQNRELYKACTEALYNSNESYRQSIGNRDFVYLLVDDILFYQRPLKSKKSLIDDCPFEKRTYIDSKGASCDSKLKCTSKSNPYYQEFRIWQFISNLRIYRDDNLGINREDVTAEFLSSFDDYAKLFEWLNNRKEVDSKAFFNTKKGFIKDKNVYWNYVVDKKYPCNTIRDIILKCAKKVGVNNYNPTIDDELEIWHLLYSIADKEELSKALKSYVEKKNLPYEFADALSLTPAFKNEYGAYSEKALKKMLPLMRQGYYWTEEAIDVKTKERIGKLISGEYDENISDRVREKVVELTDISNYQGLPVWLASYVVYNRHSEANNINKWTSPNDIDDYLKEFKQHSMRNPIVEQVILETLRTVRDIWKQVGQIDEIHVELGREMKNPADKRKAMTGQIQENEKTNQRIRLLLAEFAKNYSDIKDVRDYSPSQHEILKIYEEGVLSQVDPNDNHSKEGLDISKKAEPSAKEIQIYKEWLGQHYRSPYTGEVISLCELFTPQYEIEHIIPQSRYFDDSLSNKVVCEAAVNKLKGNMLGREFIKSHQGEIVDLGNGKTVKIFTIDEYTDFVNRHYKGSKREKLLLEDIPDGFIERQLNDSRYISKEVKGLLSNIVREEGEQEAISKNVITCNGSITDRLKQDWGMNSVWNKIILPRFVRMNELTKSDKYVTLSKEGHYIPDVPIDEKKGFNKKRIDHRHHAMDAIVIACATRNHVNLLNNEAARTKNKDMRNQLSRKLRRYENVEVIENGEKRVKNVAKEFIAPWDNFAVDAYNKLSNIVVSFKQNLRVINKTKNKYTKFVDGKKSIVTQEKGDKWAIRKSLHGGSVYGEIKIESQDGKTLKSALKNIDLIVNKKLREELKMLSEKGYSEKQIKEYFEINKDVWNGINLNSIKVFQRRFSDRKVLNKEFSKKIIEDNIADLVVRKILLAHLEENGGNAELAFSPDGIVEMNKNIVKLNNGKPHAPIRSVSKSRSGDKKFALGKSGAKLKKFVNGDVGANFYCAVREIKKIDKKTNKITIERSFKIIPLNEVIENLKQGKPIAPFVEGEKFLFTLSPNDLVYCPTKEQYGKVLTNSDIDCKRIYKMVSCDDGKCYFLPYSVASVIKKGVEFESLNKSQKAIPIELSSYESVCKLLKNNNINISEGEMIKNTCLPIKVDRLGNIIEIGY